MDKGARVTYTGDNFAPGWIGTIERIEGKYCIVLWEKLRKMRCRVYVPNLKETEAGE